jgi:Fe-Mn family superoxide dismutase
MAAPAKYTLPDLPYAHDVRSPLTFQKHTNFCVYQALKPHIMTQVMTLHHTNRTYHHQAYINNPNVAPLSQATTTSKNDIVAQLHL